MNIQHSCLYEGSVRHRRFRTKSHEFSYPLFLFYLDLDEIDDVFRSAPWISTRRLSVIRYNRADFLGGSEQSLSESIRQTVRRDAGLEFNGPIRMLAHLRYVGFVFNPITVYYCFHSNGQSLAAVVAEVSNTPWRERHCYVIPWEEAQRVKRHRCDKVFHVSPFLPMELEYQWRLSRPGRNLSIHLEDHDQDGCLLDATLLLKRKRLTSPQLVKTMLRFPWMTGQVVSGIYWQAFRLWLKKTPFYPHPESSKVTMDSIP